jgi:hypothetical protein
MTVRTSVVLVLVLAGVLGAGCSTPRPTSTSVRLDLEARVEGRTIVIAGTTDLPDGVYLLWEVDTLAYGVPGEIVQGEVRTAGGRFEDRVDVSGWPVGKVDVWVGFELFSDSDYQQPREVVDWFGPLGENLTGPNVRDMGDYRRVDDAVTLELR